jgi:hypothetical protein
MFILEEMSCVEPGCDICAAAIFANMTVPWHFAVNILAEPIVPDQSR